MESRSDDSRTGNVWLTRALFASIFARGAVRLLSHKDTPFAILELSVPIGGFTIWLLKRYPGARATVLLALFATAVWAGLAETLSGRIAEGFVVLGGVLVMALRLRLLRA